MDQEKKTILLIDDALTMHSLAERFLQKTGYYFLSAYNGQQGLDIILEHKPDLVLLDYMMPEMNGDQVFAELTTNPLYKDVSHIPIIILTARETDPALRLKFLEGGVSAYLQKPFGFRELINVIENVFIYNDIKLRNLQLQNDLQNTRDYLESLVHHTPIGILSSDREGIILKVNSYLLGILGDKIGREIVGQNLLAVNPFKSQDLPARFQATLNQGKSFQTDPFDFYDNNGRRITLVLSAVPLRESDSNIINGLIVLVQDVTKAIQREHELSMITQISHLMQGTVNLDQLLHLILTAVTAGCAMGFSRAMILLINKEKNVLEGRMGVGAATQDEAYRVWAELGKEDISLTSFLKKYGQRVPKRESYFFNELVRKIVIPIEKNDCIFIKALEEKRSFKCNTADVEMGIPHDLLNQLHFEELIVVSLIAKDDAIGVVVADNKFSFYPISDDRINLLALFAHQAGWAIERAETYSKLEREKNKLQKAYEQLKDTQERLIHAERLATIGRMAAQVAHEIRNPLVTIGGFARNIRKTAEKKSKEQLQEIADIIVQEVDRLERILKNILDFSRLSKQHPVMKNINDIIEESCFFVNARDGIFDKSIQLHKKLDPNLPLTLMDPQQIKQVLINLFENAIYSMEKGGRLEIESLLETKNVIRVNVKDTGQGISQEFLADLFNPFFTTKPDGTGLGLPISQQIVHSHGGNIYVDSEVNQGTTFSFTLKIMKNVDEFQKEHDKYILHSSD